MHHRHTSTSIHARERIIVSTGSTDVDHNTKEKNTLKALHETFSSKNSMDHRHPAPHHPFSPTFFFSSLPPRGRKGDVELKHNLPSKKKGSFFQHEVGRPFPAHTHRQASEAVGRHSSGRSDGPVFPSPQPINKPAPPPPIPSIQQVPSSNACLYNIGRIQGCG
jgi:hypothetical protein